MPPRPYGWLGESEKSWERTCAWALHTQTEAGERGSEEERPEEGSAVVGTGRAGRFSCQLAPELYVCGFRGEAQEVVALSRGKDATRFPPRSWPSALVKAVAFPALPALRAEARGRQLPAPVGTPPLHTDTGHSETAKRQGSALEQRLLRRLTQHRTAFPRARREAGPPATGPLGGLLPGARQGQVRLPHNPAGAQLTHSVDKTQAETAGKPGGASAPPQAPSFQEATLGKQLENKLSSQLGPDRQEVGVGGEPSVKTPAAASVEVRNEAGRSRGTHESALP